MASNKRGSTYAIIITSYVLIIVIFTVLMAGMFLYSADTITNQMRQSDQFIAERTVKQVSDMLKNLYEDGEMLVQDERLKTISMLGTSLSKEAVPVISGIMDRANSFTNLTTDLFFCPMGPGMIMNKTGLHQGEELEKMLMDTMGISLEEWQERVSFEGDKSFQIVAGTDQQGVWHRYFLMIVRAPRNGDGKQECFVAGIVPVTILDEVSNAMRPEGYEDIIAEYPGGVFSFHQQSRITEEDLEEGKKGNAGVFSLLFSGKPVHIATCEGMVSDWNWRLHFFCSMESYRSVVWICFRNFIISVFVVLVLGSGLLYYTLSRRNRSLKILLDRLSGKRKDNGSKLWSEYREIDRAIGELQEKHQGMENQLAEYRTKLQEIAVYQLLRGNGIREESLAEFFARQNLNLHAEKCRVLLVAMDADEMIAGMEENKAEEMVKHYLEDVKKCIYQYLPNKSSIIITDYCVECLICSVSETDDEEALYHIRLKLTNYCRENKLHFYAAISKTKTGTEGANQAFLQAESIMDHATMTGYRDTILDELPEQRSVKTKSGQDIRQQQLLEYVNEHFTDTSLSVLQMADAFDMSPSSVSRTFKQATEIGLNTYIHMLRVEKAKELMEKTSDSLKRISEEVGYGNQITMIRAFKKMEGITPKEYRDKIQNETKTEDKAE